MRETSFHVVEIGGTDEEGEFQNFFVVPDNVDARQLMAGAAAPMATCSSRHNAVLIANALNEFLAEAA